MFEPGAPIAPQKQSNPMNSFVIATRHLLTTLAGFTLLCLINYLAVQQTLRQTANDPQIQMAEDAAALLTRGETPAALALPAPAADKIDMAESLAPFLMSFDDEGKPISSNAQLGGKFPAPPAGIFAHARTHGQNRVTWQPRPGVRNATVIIHYGGMRPGFVLAARSLRQVEARVSNIGRLIAAAWAVSVCGLLVVFLALGFLSRLSQSSSVVQQR
jgi:hypothetical protein